MRLSEYIGNDNTIYEAIINETSFRMRNAIPCIVSSYNASNNTIECQPAIKERMIVENGEIKHIQLPMLVNVPVVFPGNQNLGIKFRLNQGDEVLVIFSDLSIDKFWLTGEVSEVVEARRHDLSDGMAIPCCLSIPKYNEIKSLINVNSDDVTIFNGESSINVNSDDIIFRTSEGEISINQIIQAQGGNDNEV